MVLGKMLEASVEVVLGKFAPEAPPPLKGIGLKRLSRAGPTLFVRLPPQPSQNEGFAYAQQVRGNKILIVAACFRVDRACCAFGDGFVARPVATPVKTHRSLPFLRSLEED